MEPWHLTTIVRKWKSICARLSAIWSASSKLLLPTTARRWPAPKNSLPNFARSFSTPCSPPSTRRNQNENSEADGCPASDGDDRGVRPQARSAHRSRGGSAPPSRFGALQAAEALHQVH